MTSVIIPAHNEERVLRRALDRLLADAEPGEFQVIVVPNGCTDATAEVARSVPGVTVLELPGSSKTAALNAGESLAAGFPRIYLDADIPLSTAGLRALAAAVGRPGPNGTEVLAAAPRRVVDTTARPLLVRAYYAINRRLPAYRGALFGRGAVALSATARARFDHFPESFADDLYLDSIFRPEEKVEVSTAQVVTEPPTRTRDLVRRLSRVRAANAALRAVEQRVPGSRRGSWLVDVVLPRPWLLPAGACYLAITLTAEVLARRAGSRNIWSYGRDESSRAAAGGAGR
ncbi:glycosyltransferase [Micromonospora sp. NPDC049559]|uniref:glycosyltransferase n=1 Tax=Micromonospora sp. NPDC049559 TaxID=3155923 RepID=UPI0034254806